MERCLRLFLKHRSVSRCSAAFPAGRRPDRHMARSSVAALMQTHGPDPGVQGRGRHSPYGQSPMHLTAVNGQAPLPRTVGRKMKKRSPSLHGILKACLA